MPQHAATSDGQTPPHQPADPLDVVALDDDADFRQFLGDALARDGHAVRLAATPDEFFAAVEQRQPDIAMIDMKMGRYSGEAIIAEVRARWPKLCVVVVTGFPSLDTMRRTFKQDVYDYLAKPFSLDDLRGTLAQAATELGLGGRPQDRLRRELGKQIRLARTARAWTLRELSEASTVSVSQLSSIERGAHLPSLESLLAIASAMDGAPSVWLREAGF